MEMDLCGHATLATVRILFDEYLPASIQQVEFESRSGKLSAYKNGNLIYLGFPKDEPINIEENLLINETVDYIPVELLKGKDDILAIFNDEDIILDMTPDFDKLKNLESRGLIVSAKSEKFGFVSRFFAPRSRINEDPVTGSAHTVLVPYWSKKLMKTKMTAFQHSLRGGQLECQLTKDRVMIGGKTARYMDGCICIN